MAASPAQCYLEWQPWESDRVMGLNHQMSSLSCALCEAFFLNRTLLLPDRICLDKKHEVRRNGPRREAEARCSTRRVVGFSVPTSEILDLPLLGSVVSILPTALPRTDGHPSSFQPRDFG